MNEFNQLIGEISSHVWGPVMIALLVGTGIWLTVRLRFIQIRGFLHAINLVRGKHDDHEDEGEISHFQALSSALAATIGTGNIAGVATAIASGGPGAVFWMWITAFFGMATKFASCTLAQKYRKIHPDKTASGGPMYYLEYGLGQKWLGILFAVLTVIASFGIGNMVQANSVARPMHDLLGVPPYMSGIVMALITAMVILGGIKRIAVVTSRVVPVMSIVYVAGGLVIVFMNLNQIPSVLEMIFVHAFTPTAAAGGFAGATVMETMRYGVARGVFSNEAGLGSAPIAHAAARTKEPVREGLVASLGPFIDTIIVCTLTSIVILVSGLWDQTLDGKQLTGATLSAKAFSDSLPGAGIYIVQFGMIFFAFSTILGWSYYGDRSMEYLFGKKAIRPYHWMWVLIIPLGAMIKVDLVWNISDVANGLMAIPNLIGLLLLSGVVVREVRSYRERHPHF